jgi:hypothetical protein
MCASLFVEQPRILKKAFIEIYWSHECCVCYEPTYDRTPCNHYLCDECNKQINNNLCPMCRSVIKNAEKANNQPSRFLQILMESYLLNDVVILPVMFAVRYNIWSISD